MSHSVAATESVAQVMTGLPITVNPETPVTEVFDRMEEYGIAACPVIGESGELQGMVSRVDLLRALRPSRELMLRGVEDVRRLPVREVMRCGVVTVEPTDFLLAAVDLFIDSRLHLLPVVRRGPGKPVVVGVVTQADALRHLMGSHP